MSSSDNFEYAFYSHFLYVITFIPDGHIYPVTSIIIVHAVTRLRFYHNLFVVVQEQGLKNFEFGDTQYAQGLTSDYYRGDPGDYP